MLNNLKRTGRRCGLLLCGLMLAGCSMLPTHKDDFAKLNDDFMLRVSWNEMVGASLYFAPVPKEDFLKRFEDAKDLKVTAFTAVRSEGETVDGVVRHRVHYLLEYYLLPSMSVKQKRFGLHWEKTDASTGWAIVDPFPELD